MEKNLTAELDGLSAPVARVLEEVLTGLQEGLGSRPPRAEESGLSDSSRAVNAREPITQEQFAQEGKQVGAGFEAFLARLYGDSSTAARFFDDPTGEAVRGGLSAYECEILKHIDQDGLRIAIRSFQKKRERSAGGNDSSIACLWRKWLTLHRSN